MAYLPIKLLGIINTNPAESVNSQIASYVLDNLEKIDYMSASSLAVACSVSKASVSRFCRELEYEDFYHFQLDAVRYTRNFFNKFSIEPQYDGQPLVESYLDQVKKNAEILKSQISDNMIQKMAEEVEACDHLILLGNMQSGDIAFALQHNMFVAGKSSVVAVNPREQRQLFRDMKPNTMVIVFSVSGTFFECLDFPNLLENRPANVKLYCVTTRPIQRIPSVVDCIIDCGVDNSLAGGNLSIELVANMLVLHYQKRVSELLDKEN